jgi:hypothetical protein
MLYGQTAIPGVLRLTLAVEWQYRFAHQILDQICISIDPLSVTTTTPTNREVL